VRGRRAGAAVLLAAGLAAAGTVVADAQAPARGGDWLDRPLSVWNWPGVPPPRAPEAGEEARNRQYCEASIRLPTSEVDRTLTEAGWFLFSAVQGWGDAVVLMANAAWDGMCRPSQYQFFVFVDGRFAGTLSPVLMDSRTDGAGQRVTLGSDRELTADFLRYGESDPLCCPTRLTEARFQIVRGAEGPVVVPLGAATRALPR